MGGCKVKVGIYVYIGVIGSLISLVNMLINW